MKTRAFTALLTKLTERSHIPVTRARVCGRANGTNPAFRQVRQTVRRLIASVGGNP
jgi:hypothetical protein